MKAIKTTQALLDYLEEIKKLGFATIQADNTLHDNTLLTGCYYTINDIPEPIFSRVATELDCHIFSGGSYNKWFAIKHTQGGMTVHITVHRTA